MQLNDYPILYVDDDQANRVVMKHNLGHNFRLLVADSAEAALELLSREFVAVLLTDQRMPGMSGVDLAEQVLTRYPEVIRVIITAYSDLEATIDAINRAHVNRFIKKPWTREELHAVLVESINVFATARLLKEAQARLGQMDRLVTVATLAGSIGHDMRQPLAVLMSNLDVLRREIERLQLMPHPPLVAAAIRGLAELAVEQGSAVCQLQRINDSVSKIIRSKVGPAGPLDLRSVLDTATAVTRGSIRDAGRLDYDPPPEPFMVWGSEALLLQLAVNLLVNAVQALEGRSKMSARVGVQLQHQPGGVGMVVEDNGRGIAPEHLTSIFDAFFTTKGDEGTGLGLAICKAVVEELRGTIEVESQPGRGTRFRVFLPDHPDA